MRRTDFDGCAGGGDYLYGCFTTTSCVVLHRH